MLKKTIAVVGILALSAGLANAQNKKLSPDRLLGGTVESLQKELDLTAEQVTQVETVFEDLQAKLEEADRSEIRDLATSAQTTVAGILNEEQKTKYTGMVQKGGKKGGKMGKGKGFLSIDSMKDPLELTEEQVSTLEPILTDARQDIKETNQEMRKEGVDRKEIFQEIKLIMDEYVKVIKEELTEEQGAKLDEILAARGKSRKNQKRNRKQEPGKEGDTPTGRGDNQKRKRPDVGTAVAKLGLGEEHASTLTRKIETIQELRREVGTWNRDVMKDLAALLDTTPTEEEIEAKLAEIREKRQEKTQEIRSLQEEAFEGLTVTQKARLMVEGIR